MLMGYEMKDDLRKKLRELEVKLGSYVYVYSDPMNGIPFYIGKGKGSRVLDHLEEEKKSPKVEKIKNILGNNKEPLIEFLIYGVDENTALKVEAAAIDLIGIDKLTNKQRGHKSIEFGRISIDELIGNLKGETVKITEKAVLIRINQLYSPNYQPIQLYDTTRGVWRVNLNVARNSNYALAIFNRQIKEIYKIQEWLPAGSTFSTMHTREDIENEGKRLTRRYEFVGNIAEDKIREKYLNKLVEDYIFVPGNANPIRYLNINGKEVFEDDMWNEK